MTGSTDTVAALMVAVSSYLMILSAFSYNDAYDVEHDKITGFFERTRNFSKKQLITLTYLLWIIAFLIAASTTNWNAVVIVSASLTLAFIYSHPMFNFKEKFPFKTLITALDASTACLIGAAVGNSFSSYTLFSSAGFFVYFFILGPLGDFQDIKGDQLVGRRTFPIVLGSKKTIAIMMSIPIILIMTAGILFLGVLPNNGLSQGIDLGVVSIFSVCIISLLLITKIKKRLDDFAWVKQSRTIMRFLHILFQLSVVMVFFRI